MASMGSRAQNEDQIRALIDDRVTAVRTRDVDRAMAHTVPDILMFDVVNPLQYVGSDAARKRTEEWFSSFQGPIGFDVQELSITSGGGCGLLAQPQPRPRNEGRWREARHVVAHDHRLPQDRWHVDGHTRA